MVRYPKSIAYGFKIAPELEEMRIPKFTLQPLVENYFAHGVDHRRTTQRSFEHEASYSGERQSIGIVNVHERFVLYFGDRYQISVESAEQEGVRYHIIIQDE